MTQKEEKDLKEKLAASQDTIAKLKKQIDKSSVDAVNKANRERDKAINDKYNRIKEIQATERQKVYEADRKQRLAEAERDEANAMLKKRSFLYFSLLAIVLFIISLRNKQFLSDFKNLFKIPAIYLFKHACKYMAWLKYPTYSNGNKIIAFNDYWAWILRILTVLVMITAICGVIYSIILLIKIYCRRWCTLSIKVLVISYSALIVFGDIIRLVIPINLLLLIILSQVIYLFVLWYFDGYYEKRGLTNIWTFYQNR
jgi:hypothetical protein